jgi:hypothetical protein
MLRENNKRGDIQSSYSVLLKIEKSLVSSLNYRKMAPQ